MNKTPRGSLFLQLILFIPYFYSTLERVTQCTPVTRNPLVAKKGPRSSQQELNYQQLDKKILNVINSCSKTNDCVKKAPYKSKDIILKVVPLYEKPQDNKDVIREWEGIKVLQSFKDTMKMEFCLEFGSKVVFGFEKLEMDIHDAIKKPGFLNSQKKYDISMKLALILKELHDVGITHGDIKVGNVMCADKNCDIIKLIDFGHVAVKSNYNALGTFKYNSPEIPQRDKSLPQTTAADVWAFVCLILDLVDYEILRLFNYYRENRKNFVFDKNVYERVERGIKNFFYPKNMKAANLFLKWLDMNPKTRPNIDIVINDLKVIGPNIFRKTPL